MAFHVLVKPLAGRFGRHWRITAVTAWVFAASLDATFAQSIASSALNGTVRDGTGGALPGVTVTITSPVSVPGISMVGVLKSGGNEFHGIYAGGFETPKLQASNLDDSLRAQGLSATSPLESWRLASRLDPIRCTRSSLATGTRPTGASASTRPGRFSGSTR